MYKNHIKRFVDFALSLMMILCFSPLFFIISVVFVLVFRQNPFFIQKRLGKDAIIFSIIKFKTMTDEKDENGEFLPDEKRLTKFGNFLRKTSLDELPQLINVLKGDMSLVGPRPLLPYYMDLYNDFQKRRNEVKPGITGLAQINGRNHLPWQQRFEYDIWYIDNLSCWLDIKILFLTILKVLKSEGVSGAKQSISQEFEGND
ncbi:MAG: sugar transferase [Cruoricaptor ignavus]|nr:sugar transferase [Cruoricaptor ignavus]